MIKTYPIPTEEFRRRFCWLLPPPKMIQASERELGFHVLMNELPHRGLAIVGTRTPTQRAITHTREVIRDLARSKSDLVIISGLARGIDAEAHESALKYGLRTIAVLGGGIEKLYPRENEDLAHRIIKAGGMVISEWPDTEDPRPNYFLQRNRIIAGLAQATWVVEGGEQSGALSTASWARRYDLDVYATPVHPLDEIASGNRKLLETGAHPVWGAHSFQSTWIHLDIAQLEEPTRPRRSRKTKALNRDRSRIDWLIADWRARGGAVALSTALLDWGGSVEELLEALSPLIQQSELRLESGWLVFSGAEPRP